MKEHQPDGDGAENNHEQSELTSRLTDDRLSAIEIFFALDPFRGDLERPSHSDGDGKTDDRSEDNQAHRPIRDVEKRKDLRRDLNQEPADDDIGHGHVVNAAPFQFGEEGLVVHRFCVGEE